jgi:hypothetical protein
MPRSPFSCLIYSPGETAEILLSVRSGTPEPGTGSSETRNTWQWQSGRITVSRNELQTHTTQKVKQRAGLSIDSSTHPT